MSREGKWTPGPWFTLSGPGTKLEVSNSVKGDWCAPEHFICEAEAANAKLIAAAPQMAEALRRVRNTLYGDRWERLEADDTLGQEARAALRAAGVEP